MDGSEELLNSEHCSKISMMDGEAAENIYLLILHYFMTNNKSKTITNDISKLSKGLIETPYKSKPASKDGKGLKFSVSYLPDEIQRIIVRYLRIISY